MIVVNHLGGGGTERISSYLSRHLSRDLFDVHLVLISQDRLGAEPTPSWLNVHRLNRVRIRQSWVQLLRLIWVERPSLVFSGISHLNYLLLILKLFMPVHTRIVVRQNTTASQAPATYLSNSFYRYLYPFAFRVICQSQDMANDFALHYGIARQKLLVLHNPVDTEQIQTKVRAFREESFENLHRSSSCFPHLLAVGRLAYEKGFDLLLPAVAQLKHHFPRLRLTVAGAGVEEAALRRLSYKLNLDSQVDFAGYQVDLTDYYRRASLFVLSSRYEGMPNALLEAAAAGLPIVSTCCAGIGDLLAARSHPVGDWPFTTLPGTWLTPSISVEGLAECLLTATRYLECGNCRFDHAFLKPFELKTAIRAYEETLADAATNR